MMNPPPFIASEALLVFKCHFDIARPKWVGIIVKMKKSIFMLVLVAFLSSCSQGGHSKDDFDSTALIATMKQDGWSYLEILGIPGKSEAETMLDSKTARAVTAFWVTNGKRLEKIYQQTDSLYAVITCQKADGDTFSMVFKRSKS